MKKSHEKLRIIRIKPNYYVNVFSRFCSHKSVNNQREIDKGEKDNIEFIIAGKNAAKAFDTPKQSLDLISLFVQLLIIAPGIFSVPFRWNDRDIPKLQSQGSRFVTFISPIHQQMNRTVNRIELPQESTTFRSVAAVSCRQCKRYPIPIRCGDHMKFGIPSSSCSPDGLRPTFFKAPIPSG